MITIDQTPAPESASPPQPKSKLRRWGWPILKWGLCAAVVIFVALRARELWDSNELDSVSVSPGWLLLGTAAYVAGWLPSAWYWRRLMHAMQNDISGWDAARAYYCGHLGKYMPGKAAVLVIRAGMMKARGFSAAIAAVTATFETLLMMGAGLAVGLALFPVIGWPPAIAEYISPPWIMPPIVAAAVAVALPVIALLLRKFAAIMTPRDLSGDQRVAGIDVRLIAIGLCLFVVSWSLHGLSLGCTLRAVSTNPFDLTDWPMWTGTVALSASIGFLMIFAPGGIGVREGLLIEILRDQPGIGEKTAVVVAVLLRLEWVAAEFLAAAGLYYLVKPKHVDVEDNSLKARETTE